MEKIRKGTTHSPIKPPVTGIYRIRGLEGRRYRWSVPVPVPRVNLDSVSIAVMRVELSRSIVFQMYFSIVSTRALGITK